VDTDFTLPDLGGLPGKKSSLSGAGVVGPRVRLLYDCIGCRCHVDRPAARRSGSSWIGKSSEALSYHLRQMGVTFRLAEKVTRVGDRSGARSCFCRTGERQESKGDAARFMRWAARPTAINFRLGSWAGFSGGLAGKGEGERILPRLTFRTSNSAGDVIRLSGHLQAPPWSRGRLAACHMFGIPFEHMPPFSLTGFTPFRKISMVGQTEETLRRNKNTLRGGNREVFGAGKGA